MTMTDLVKRIRNELGLSNNFIFSMSPYDMAEHIKKYTLPQFSELNQFKKEVKISFTESDILDEVKGNSLLASQTHTKLPRELVELHRAGLKIFSVGNMKEISHGMGGERMIGFPMGGMPSYSDEASRALYSFNRNRERSIARAKLEGNKLIIKNTNRFDLLNKTFKITVSLYHTENLWTISGGLSNRFVKLCTLDIANFLYENQFKYIDQTELGSVTIDLKLDFFREAGARKQEEIERIRESIGLDMFGSYT